MKCSVCIPTYNAGPYISRLLRSIREQAPDCEIVVIDSSSTDATVSIAKSCGAGIIVIQKKDFDHGGTRTLAANSSLGDILVFLTQDIVFADDRALESLIKYFDNDKNIAAVYGRQLPNADASPFSAHLRLFNYQDTSYVRCLEDRHTYGIKTVFFSNSFSAYKRSALEKIGCFKRDLIFGEDTHAIARLLLAGFKIAYASDAMVYHSHNYTVFEEFKRYFDIGVMHRTEDWILKEFGQTKGEGKKYIKSEALYLMRHKKYNFIPAFILRNAMKYLGYQLGLRYSHVPKGLTRRISMNKNWWENKI
jgi:rhamnosyltransferase